MKKVFLLAGVLFSLLFTSCTPNDATNLTDSLKSRNPVDVFVAGANNNIAAYWKNGVATSLGKGVSGTSEAMSVFVSGSDVYVAGTENIDLTNGIAENSIAKYWKNGVSVSLTDGTNSAAYASSIVVVGNDVYVAGGVQNVISRHVDAMYWKNGVAVNLGNLASDTEAISLEVSGGDVYVAGYESPSASVRIAKYWKNGVAVNLTDGTSDAYAADIAVVGTDVYVAGSVNEKAKYWKNGSIVSLPSSESDSFAESIAVVGTDVYVCGAGRATPLSSDATKAKYWKNGVEVSLGSSRTFSDASSITVLDNNVYITGQNYEDHNDSSHIAALWINGVLTTAGNVAYGNSVFVTPHQ